MKNFMKGILEWKSAASLLYTGTMAIYLGFCLLFHQEQVETSMVWSLLLMSAAGSLIQGLCFTEWVFKKVRYTWRLALFCLFFLPLLSAVAWAFHWFPADAAAWLEFVGIFFAVFLIMTAGFELYFRLAGRKYDGLLGQYRKEKEENEEQ